MQSFGDDACETLESTEVEIALSKYTTISCFLLTYEGWSENKNKIYFALFIFSCNENGFKLTVPLILHFYVVPATAKTFIISCGEIFYFLLTEVSVLCYQPSRHNCFHFAITFEYVAASI